MVVGLTAAGVGEAAFFLGGRASPFIPLGCFIVVVVVLAVVVGLSACSLPLSVIVAASLPFPSSSFFFCCLSSTFPSPLLLAPL